MIQTLVPQQACGDPALFLRQANEGIARLPTTRAGVPYYLYLPRRLWRHAQPIVAVHGISRRAEEHAAAFAPLADHLGRVVVAPLFTKQAWPRYQQVVDGDRADLALLAVLREIGAQLGVPTERFDLFGFSGGAQFAHRFAMLHAERVTSLALSSAGWYTWPDPAEAFPYGLGPTKDGAEPRSTIDRFLQIPIMVLVGDVDLSRDRGLRQEQRVDRRQGLSRVERAARWARALRDAAAERGIEPQVEFATLPHCGHSFKACVAQGLAERVVTWFERRPGICGSNRIGAAQLTVHG